MEQSATFHVFADVLSALSRTLSDRLPDTVVARADVRAVGDLLYVTLHAVAGAALGAMLGTAVSRRTLRVVVLAAALAVFDSLLLGAVWRHRGLPAAVGLGIVAAGAIVAAAAATVAGALGRGLPDRARRIVAVATPTVLLAATAVVLVSAGRPPSRPPGRPVTGTVREPTGTRVAVIALDGLDGRLVDEALAAGRMPHLATLIAKGVRGDLRSIRPPKSPVVWTSVVTGVLPKRHGIRDFVVVRDGERIPVTSNLRRVPALWNLSGPWGFTVAFVNWYVTWPAEPVNGVLVSDRADFAGLDDRVWPPDLTVPFDSARALVDAAESRDITRFAGDPAALSTWRTAQWGQVDRSLGILDDVVRHDLVTLAGAGVALDRGQPDLTAVYFRGTDNTQHLFWKHRMAARLGAERARLLYGDIDSTELVQLAPVIDRYYDFADEMLGRLLARLDPETAVLVVSDHGFLTNNERGRWFGANRLLAALDLAASAEGGRADSAGSTVFDPAPPTVAARRVLRAGGRASDAEAALRAARARLVALRTDRDEPVFRSTALGSDERGPWLAVVFGSGLQGRSVDVDGRGVTVKEFLQPEGHSGDHRMDGFLLAAGPPFRHGTVQGARAIDLAPTIAYLLGVAAARDQEGVVLTDLLDPAWRSAHPVTYVDTWGSRDETGTAAISTDADERIRNELRALGYIK